jgi:hypothetical protein
MRRRPVELTLALALALVALSAWADKHREPTETTRPTWPRSGSKPSTMSSSRKPPRRLKPRGSTASRPSPSTRLSCRARCTTARWWAS